MIEVAIFDLDGTILNTIDDLGDSCNVILKKHGFPLHTISEYKYFVGNGIPKLIERALPENAAEDIRKEVLDEFIQYYQNHSSIKTAPYEGISELLQKLKAAGIKLAVNTNKVQKASEDLCQKYFPGIFDVVAGNQSEIPVKPAPDGVFKILDLLKISKDQAQKGGGVFIGDSDVDIATGKNCGIKVIGVDWGFRGEEFLKAHGAGLVVKTAPELLDALL